jgi:hypothetical protein
MQADTLVRQSRLYGDLHRDHRDAMYRAMTFIERQGGPPLAGDTTEVLVAHRERALTWLLLQPEPGDLLAAYESFAERWSPVFPE